ncbi:MAG: S58 family peptidase [Acidobacteria bacterium]|nr:MAG: S58 family peptidase [Acidobacteriota bacterium]
MLTVLFLAGAPSLGRQAAEDVERPRARALGIAPGVLATGPLNAITDVDGVRVGHATLIEGDSVRTGVTAIVPHGGNVFQQKAPAAVWAANAFGKAAGFLQVRELGTLESPIVLTNTLSVGTAVEAVVAWTLGQAGNEAVTSVNAVVGETNDGWLNDIRRQAIRGQHVVAALDAAGSGPVEEGSIGAGTGTVLYGWKGGIGTSSRRLPDSLGAYTVGVLVQSNFGGVLTVDGARVGEALGRYSFRDEIEAAPAGAAVEGSDASAHRAREGDGSCMIVVATDAPLTSRDLERLARRAPLGLARTGSFISNGSGDFVIAFSTAYRVAHDSDSPVEQRTVLRTDALSPLFLAVVEATEEAVYNSLLRATTVSGQRGRVVEAIDVEALQGVLGRR